MGAMANTSQPRRLDLLWLTPEGWRIQLAGLPEHQPVLEYWRQEDWPVAVRRCDPGLDEDLDPALELCAAIGLPPDADGHRPRLALRVPLAHVARCSPPLTLQGARPALPPHWRPPYTELQRLAVGLDLRVTGPLSWQALTLLPCIGPDDPIELQLRPMNLHQLQAGLALLSAGVPGLKLAGEILFPSGDAVGWREWLSATGVRGRVVAKSLHAVRMAEQDELLASLRRG